LTGSVGWATPIGMRSSPRSDLPTVLVVDDEGENLRFYARTLRASFTVIEATSGAEALAIAERSPEIAVIITDQRMPGMEGVELLSRLAWLADVPKIIITAHIDPAPILAAVNACALFGYLMKPVQPEQLRALVRRAADEYHTTLGLRRSLMRLEEENRELKAGNGMLARSAERLHHAHGEIQTSLEAMQQAYQKMAELAHRDDLTGLRNRRTFVGELAREFNRYRRYKRPATLLVGDIARFEVINDRHGHATGDRVLMALADILSSNVRDNDGVFRLGGHAFAVILPETAAAAAAIVAAKLRAAVRAWRHEELLEGFDISIGLLEVHEEVATADDWYALADTALYEVKRAQGCG
jgi:diguanylate cyclase (GGDEF)-like protein